LITAAPAVAESAMFKGRRAVTVLNWMPTGSQPCTMIYGSYELSINFGGDFRPGTAYSVSVNDKSTVFVAR
jgi:hypothetical protein